MASNAPFTGSKSKLKNSSKSTKKGAVPTMSFDNRGRSSRAYKSSGASYKGPVSTGSDPDLGRDMVNRLLSHESSQNSYDRMHDSSIFRAKQDLDFKKHESTRKASQETAAYKHGLIRNEDSLSGDVNYRPIDHLLHFHGELTDHDKAMQRQTSAQNHQRSMQMEAERAATGRLVLSNLFRSRDERKRRRASERARKSAAKLDLKRDRQRYIAADRAAAKAAKRERKRIVVQRGYY